MLGESAEAKDGDKGMGRVIAMGTVRRRKGRNR